MKRFLVFAFTLVGLAGWQGSAAASTEAPGCDPSRPAVAHDSDGTIVNSSTNPVPCAVTTGYGGAESHIEVAPNGDVILGPAMTAPGLLGEALPPDNARGPRQSHMFANATGLALSKDLGASWLFVEPAGSRYACCDHHLHIDPVTGRLFYSAIFGAAPPPLNKTLMAAESQVMSSPYDPTPETNYMTWVGPATMLGHISENPRFTTAPAPAGQPASTTGERMAYWCANSTLSSTTRDCYRSYDGGASWQFASDLYIGVPMHSECGTSQESAGYPQGGPDGSLWVTFSCGGNNYLARSTDAGSTWPFVKKNDGSTLTLPAAGQLRVDPAGNLYLLASGLQLRVSTDGGQNWNGPFNMTAPAARDKTIGQSAGTIGYQPGEVAVAYFATREAGGGGGSPLPFPLSLLVPSAQSGSGEDGYITVTHDALSANPVFYSAVINPPSTPMVNGTRHAGDDFIDVALGPDGTPWADFYSDCLKDQAGNFVDPFCAQTGGQEEVNGMQVQSHATTVGSLRWP